MHVTFLPPNTTSKLQPLDAGVIAYVKAMYRRRLLFRVFDNIDAGRKSIYHVDILTAMRWTVEEWESCPATVIKNCFSHCFKQDCQAIEELEAELQAKTLQNMERDAKEHGIAYTKTGIQNLLNPGDEDNVVEDLNYDELVREVAGLPEECEAQCGTEEQNEVEEDVYTIE